MESIKFSVPVDKLADVKAYAAKIGGVTVTESLGEDVSGETVVVTLEGSDPINVDEVKAFAEKRCNATDEVVVEDFDGFDSDDVDKDEVARSLIKAYLAGKALSDEDKDAILEVCADCGAQSITPEEAAEDPNLVFVDLPDDNVGPIYIEKTFADTAKKLDKLADELWEYDNVCAGWEIFSTLCWLLNCEWYQVADEEWDNLDWPDVKDEPKYDPEDPMTGDDFWD